MEKGKFRDFPVVHQNIEENDADEKAKKGNLRKTGSGKHYYKKHLKKSSTAGEEDSKILEKIESQPAIKCQNNHIENQIADFFQSSINPILLLLGMRKINISWEEQHHSPTDSYDVAQSKVSRETLGVLAAMEMQISRFIEEQKKLTKIMRIQAVTRGYLVRNRLKKLQDPVVMKIVKRRNLAFIDIIKTEKQYISDLEIVINYYLIPLRKNASTQEQLQDIIGLFCNIETIVEVHKKLLMEMIKIRNLTWPFVTGIGELFLKQAQEFQHFGDYAENFATSLSTLKVIQTSNKKSKTREVLEAPPGGIAKLKSLLILPVQRMGKYEFMLEHFSNLSMGIDIKDQELISRAHSITKNIHELINRKLDQADRFAQTQEIQRTLISELPVCLHTDTRFFITKGTLSYYYRKKTVNYFLFNDLLVLCKSVGDKNKVISFLNLMNCSINEPSSQNKGYDLISDELKGGNLTFKMDKSLQGVIAQIQTHKKTGAVFGVDLAQLLAREKRDIASGGNCIPRVVEFLASFLRLHLNTVGILRLPGNFEQAEKLKRRLDNINIKNYAEVIDMEQEEVHVVASIFRAFFRELPEPLILFSRYEPLIEIQRNENYSMEERIKLIQAQLLGLPQENLLLLKFIITFLQEIEVLSPINKMTVTNLAIVFGPNLIRPKVETVQNALEMPLLHGVIQILIEQSDLIFPQKGRAIDRNRSHQFSPSGRPLSVLFVGKELKPLLQNELEREIDAERRRLLESIRLRSNLRETSGEESLRSSSGGGGSGSGGSSGGRSANAGISHSINIPSHKFSNDDDQHHHDDDSRKSRAVSVVSKLIKRNKQ